MRFQVLGCALALAATAANAQNSTYCLSGGPSICYTVNVAANAEKDLFFQITAPTSISWVGLGQGSGMSGANIFVIYANAAGTNVTVSPRLGTGHVEPGVDNTAMISLLDGSMVSNGMMTANVKCSNCQSWSGGSMDLTSSSTDWIYAYQAGSPMNSDSVSASINIHDQQGTFTLNLAAATGGDGTVNPFTNMATGASNSSMSSLNSNGMSINSTTGMAVIDPTEKMIMDGTTAHGVMGAIAFILLFPTGSIVMRIFNFKYLIWVHVGIQVIGYLVALALMETGVWIAVNNEVLMMAHPIIGLVVVCGLFFQPFLGIGHHVLYKREGGPNILTYPHIWWGRILITLGIVNGFFGLRLTGNIMGIKIAYIAVAGVVWAVWMGVALLAYMRSRDVQRVKEKPIIRRIDSYDG